MSTDFRDKAPLSAAEAATIILDGVRSGAWRILVGEDAKKIDAAVRAKPEHAYDYAELCSADWPKSHRHQHLTSSSHRSALHGKHATYADGRRDDRGPRMNAAD